MKIIKKSLSIVAMFMAASMLASDQQPETKLDAELKAQQDAKINAEFTNAMHILFQAREQSVDCYKSAGLPTALRALVFEKLQVLQKVASYENQHLCCQNGFQKIIKHRDMHGNDLLLLHAHKKIHLFAYPSLQPAGILNPHNDYLTQIIAQTDANNNQFLITSSKSGLIQVLDLSNAAVQNLQGHTSIVRSVATFEDTTAWYIVSASDDRTIKVWYGKSGKEIYTLNNPDHYAIRNLITHKRADENYLIIGSSDTGTIHVWNAHTGELLNSFDTKAVSNMLSYQDDQQNLFILTTSYENEIDLWNGYTGKRLCQFKGHGKKVSCIDTFLDDQNKRYLVSASDDKTIRLWDLPSGKCLDVFNYEEPHSINSLNCFIDAQKGLTFLIKNSHAIEIWQFAAGAFEKAIITQRNLQAEQLVNQRNLEHAQAIMQLPNPNGGNGLPVGLRRLIADYAVSSTTN